MKGGAVLREIWKDIGRHRTTYEEDNMPPKSTYTDPQFQLGDEVRDSLTGFQGIISGRTEYITGCDQYLVQSPVGADNKIETPHWIDGDRLVLVQAAKIMHEVSRAGFGDAPPVK